MIRALRWGCVWCGLVGLGAVARGADWPQFRGPAGDGLPTAERLPVEWSETEHVAWKVDLPGVAWSQPIVLGERIYLTTAVSENQPRPAPGMGGRGGNRGRDRGEGAAPQGAPPATNAPAGDAGTAGPPAAEAPSGTGEAAAPEPAPGPRGPRGRGQQPPDQVYRWLVECRDLATGQVVWERQAHEGRPTIPTHRTNTYASETPVTDGERLYAYFGMTGLYCFDLEGEPLWSKQLGSFPMMLGWGTGSSPLVADGRLFVQCDNEQTSFLLALEAKTGAELWRVERPEKSNWSTPYLWKHPARTELVVAGGGKMRGYDPADGRVLWELGELKGRSASTPVGTAELLFLGVGGGMAGPGPLLAVKSGAAGDITLAAGETTNAHVAWSRPRSGPAMASPLVYQGCLYVLDQRGGIVACHDAATGEEHYRQRLEGAKGFTSSPWAHAGRVFCLDEEGQTFVLAAGPQLEVLGINKLDDMFWSSVAVAGDKLLLRGLEYLYCLTP